MTTSILIIRKDVIFVKNSKDGRDHHHSSDHLRDYFIVVILIISKDSPDHPRALGFRRVLLLLGGESLFCLPPYTEPTHYYPAATLQTDAIKCISVRCN